MTPEKWAIRISHIVSAAMGDDRFPIDVSEVAREISHHLYPDDPISVIKGAPLSSFDGALARAPVEKQGWGIFYNDDIESQGRINFTLGHEFGHYLLHRLEHLDGFNCTSRDLVRLDNVLNEIEHQANVFASYLLMPLDDFRRQIPPLVAPTFDDLSACANRYGVSLTAAALKWIKYTERRAILVMSRDGFVLWAWSSDSAYRSGAFIKTADRPPIPVPTTSLAADPVSNRFESTAREHGEGVWLQQESCDELALFSDRYDFAMSLLHLPSKSPAVDLHESDVRLRELDSPSW
ncbi:MAG: ImmA/IrrE family metallo-endopeptidase [Gammaproteobacteria bacterium]|nr:ImmA/IrrE family metallo-endopeptidase [Gammaproteobacteria bacterium]